MQGNTSLPAKASPIARQWASMKPSSSSTTVSRSTEAAKSRISPSGRGQAMPSFRTGKRSPQTSFTY